VAALGGVACSVVTFGGPEPSLAYATEGDRGSGRSPCLGEGVGVARQMLHDQHAIVAGKAYGRSYWLAGWHSCETLAEYAGVAIPTDLSWYGNVKWQWNGMAKWHAGGKAT
jgi:hypothetical protein